MIDSRQQPMTSYGDLISPYTNRVLCDSEVDTYNLYTIDFNRFTYTDEKEFMLDQRHRFVNNCFYEGFK